MRKLIFTFLLIRSLSITFPVLGQTQVGGNLEVDEALFSLASSVSMSQNGNCVAVGGYGRSNWGFRVYELDGNDWLQLGNDISQDPNNIFSYEVALSATGNTVAVGEIINSPYSDFGNVKIYEFDGVNWSQIGSTIYGENDSDLFGLSLSLSADGTKLIIGAKFNNNSTGEAKVFEYNGTDWYQLGSDLSGDHGNHYFAGTVSISADGSCVAIGANQFAIEEIGEDGEAVHIPVGLTRIFEFDGTEWIQKGNDLLGEDIHDNFGVGFSLSSNGNRIAIGASEIILEEGYVKVYDFNGSNWEQIGTTIHGENVGDKFGRMVVLSGDGNKLAVGSPSNETNQNRAGIVKIFQWLESDWAQVGEDIEGDFVMDEFGESISLSQDGNFVVIGALNYEYQQSGTEVGYAKVFDISNLSLSTEKLEINSFVLYPNPVKEEINIIGADNIKEVLIYNSSGKMVLKEGNIMENIDLSLLPSGIYFVKLVSFDNQKRVEKIIKY